MRMRYFGKNVRYLYITRGIRIKIDTVLRFTCLRFKEKNSWPSVWFSSIALPSDPYSVLHIIPISYISSQGTCPFFYCYKYFRWSKRERERRWKNKKSESDWTSGIRERSDRCQNQVNLSWSVNSCYWRSHRTNGSLFGGNHWTGEKVNEKRKKKEPQKQGKQITSKGNLGQITRTICSTLVSYSPKSPPHWSSKISSPFLSTSSYNTSLLALDHFYRSVITQKWTENLFKLILSYSWNTCERRGKESFGGVSLGM